MSKKNIKEILCENCKMNCKHLANNSLIFNCFFNHNDSDALLRAWNFCASQYESELEELKKKLEGAVGIIEDLCSSVEECPERAKAKAFLEGVKVE